MPMRTQTRPASVDSSHSIWKEMSEDIKGERQDSTYDIVDLTADLVEGRRIESTEQLAQAISRSYNLSSSAYEPHLLHNLNLARAM